MSSLEIAERTEKRHDNVMRDIRAMLIELYGEGGLLSFEDTLTNPQNNQEYPIYRLPKRECMILVAGYSIPLRMAVAGREAMRRSSDAMPSSTSAGTSRIDRESSSRGTSTAWIGAGLALVSCLSR
ncbi:hypothetical protein GPNCGGLF_LOCUS2095 [Methylorubrum aminovorans]